MESSTSAAPERPRRLRCRFACDGTRLTISYRGFDASGCFLTLWLIGWTVGCVFLVGMVIREPKVENVLFAVPFCAAWVFVFVLVMNSFFRVEFFELGPEGVRFIRRVIVVLSRREIPLTEIQDFRSYSKVADSESGTRQRGIEVHTLGRELRFGQGLPDEERNWLIAQLNDHLGQLKPDSVSRAPVSEAVPEQAVADQFSSAETSERLTPSPSPLDPPSDSRWQRLHDFRDIHFAKRGRFGCAAVGVLLFINAFWNGIVSVFVGVLFSGEAPKGWEWWGMFVFLIPFEVIGLVMFVGLLAALFEPFHRTKWTFSYGEVQWRSTWLGIGPRRVYPVEWLDRVELRHVRKQGPAQARMNGQNIGDQSDYALVFIDGQNIEAFSVQGLTEGEARWMADTVLHERRQWFS